MQHCPPTRGRGVALVWSRDAHTIAATIKKTVQRIDFEYEIKANADEVKVTAYRRKGD